MLCEPTLMSSRTRNSGAPDANVRAFLKREHELNMAKAYCDQTDFVSRNADFAEKGTIKVLAATRARQVGAAAEEMKSAHSVLPRFLVYFLADSAISFAGLDAELVTSRRARLKKFYAEQNAVYQAELSAMGLSLAF